jgi:3-dehydroquinate synthase
MGMAVAAVISERQRYLSAEDRERIIAAIGRVGLPVRIPQALDTGRILSRLATDKKKAGGKIHFVLLRKPGMPFVNGGVPLELVKETIEALKA